MSLVWCYFVETSAHDLQNVFDTFYTSKKPSGNGLGLAISKKNTEENRGKIWCESESKTPSVNFYIALNISENLEQITKYFHKSIHEFLDDAFHGKWD